MRPNVISRRSSSGWMPASAAKASNDSGAGLVDLASL
jgi:hypothetical protein